MPELVADPLLMPQLSTWRDARALSKFAFRSGHAAFYKRRHAWFEDWPGGRAVLWWWAGDGPPSLADAFDRWRAFQEEGATAYAFSLKAAARYPRPGD